MSRRGSVLVMTFAIMLLLLALTGGYLVMTSVSIRNSGWEETDAHLIWLAEAGLAKGVWYLRVNTPVWPPGASFTETLGLGAGQYQVTVVRNAGALRTVTSIGRITTGGNTYTRTIRKQYTKAGGAGTSPVPVANSWIEL